MGKTAILSKMRIDERMNYDSMEKVLSLELSDLHIILFHTLPPPVFCAIIISLLVYCLEHIVFPSPATCQEILWADSFDTCSVRRTL